MYWYCSNLGTPNHFHKFTTPVVELHSSPEVKRSAISPLQFSQRESSIFTPPGSSLLNTETQQTQLFVLRFLQNAEERVHYTSKADSEVPFLATSHVLIRIQKETVSHCAPQGPQVFGSCMSWPGRRIPRTFGHLFGASNSTGCMAYQIKRHSACHLSIKIFKLSRCSSSNTNVSNDDIRSHKVAVPWNFGASPHAELRPSPSGWGLLLSQLECR